MSLAALDYSRPATVHGDGHIVDGLAAGLNMLGEELHASTVSREHVDSILRSMADGLIVVDQDDRIEEVNPALTRLLGYERAELIGSTCELFCVDAAAPGCSFDDLASQVLAAPTEVKFRTRDGRVIPVQLTGSPLHAHDGSKRGTVCVAADITARKQMEAAMAAARDAALQSAELKAAFLANMSHEIRTPLNGVIGMAELLRDRQLPAQEREMVEAIQTSARALLDIVNDVLDFSKIDAGKLDLELSDFELGEVVEDLLQVHALSAQQKKIELLAVVEDDVPRRIHGDATRIRQVLNNLVSNAVKFTEVGEVAVRVGLATRDEDHCVLRFEVRDTGVGVPPEARDNIFDAFAQADASTTRRFQGTGLGLTISARLVDAMDGEIGLDSQHEPGSLFWFTLPVEVAASTETEERPDLDGARVLVADDNATNRRILRSQIEGWNGLCDTAASGAEALALGRRADRDDDPYRALVLDLNMPEMDGLMLARAVREDPDLFEQPGIVVLTSYLSPISGDIQTELAISHCLTKPAKPEQLAQAVMRATRREIGTLTPVPIEPAPAVQRNSATVLVVDDNPINQKVALGQLAKLGLRAQAVGNGIEALDAVRVFPYALVLLDVYMPEMDGYEATRLLRAHPELRDLPIVAMTASATAAERQGCLDAGMNDFLAKPITEGALRAVLKRWLPGWRSPASSRSGELALPPVDGSAPADEPVDAVVLDRLRKLERATGKSGFVAELLEMFLKRTPETLNALREALDRGDHEAARVAAHSLKGSSGNVGAQSMQQLAGVIEHASTDGELGRATREHDRLVSEFERVAEAFRRRLLEEEEGR